MEKLKIKTFIDNYDFEQQKIVLGEEILWESGDLCECPEDATLSRDMTNAEQVIRVASRLRMVDYEEVYINCTSLEEYENDTP